MNSSKNDLNPKATFSQRALAAWEHFWYTPADPTVLGLIRICTGLITLYTVLVYTPSLQEFFGRQAWWDLPSALRNMRDRPVTVSPLRGYEVPPPFASDVQQELTRRYMQAHGFPGIPPWPYPSTEEEVAFASSFLKKHGFDFRLAHLPFPHTNKEKEFLERYADEFEQAPARFPQNEQDEKYIFEYARRYGHDPYNPTVYARGTPTWSIWFHVTDPGLMMAIHLAIVLVTFLFMIGFCTRLTSVLTWIGQLSYIHRSGVQLFGVDTMMTILLLYLMIGPSGAAWSVDRRIGRWWRTARPRVINRWRSLWRLPPVEVMGGPGPNATELAGDKPQLLVSANFAMRLLQVHVCIIYMASGLAKLLGRAWWEGTAVWGTLANYEFAPMQYPIYNQVLRLLGKNSLVLYSFLTIAVYFTLFFEIGYAFLIWRKATRWLILAMAITLHGLIGLFMGLKTFSLIMLVMNMAFLRPEEVNWVMAYLLGNFRRRPGSGSRNGNEPVANRAMLERAPVNPASPSSR